jgi:hypothetical protein
MRSVSDFVYLDGRFDFTLGEQFEFMLRPRQLQAAFP